MIIEPIFCSGKSTIGGVQVDMNHYYVILKACDVHVEDNGRLVTLAMSDIQWFFRDSPSHGKSISSSNYLVVYVHISKVVTSVEPVKLLHKLGCVDVACAVKIPKVKVLHKLSSIYLIRHWFYLESINQISGIAGCGNAEGEVLAIAWAFICLNWRVGNHIWFQLPINLNVAHWSGWAKIRVLTVKSFIAMAFLPTKVRFVCRTIAYLGRYIGLNSLLPTRSIRLGHVLSTSTHLKIYRVRLRVGLKIRYIYRVVFPI